ncbi:MAG TPA: DUF6391 domain-containing protein [Pelolinea sp.]|nr:DUF6391 domain-containing protein [Pelolinea sp.]
MSAFDELLKQNLPSRVRSNHALEHATLHVLQEKGNTVRLGGISDAGGFWIYGNVDTETLLLAAQEAHGRLAGGESHLAVHPNCGTNIAVGALAAGSLSWMGMLGTRGRPGRRLLRIPVAVLLGLVGYQVAKPLGPKLQEQVTTDADVSHLEVLEVVRHDVMGTPVHRVTTRMLS